MSHPPSAAACARRPAALLNGFIAHFIAHRLISSISTAAYRQFRHFQHACAILFYATRFYTNPTQP